MKQTLKNIIFSGLVLLALLVLAEGFQRVRLIVLKNGSFMVSIGILARQRRQGF